MWRQVLAWKHLELKEFQWELEDRDSPHHLRSAHGCCFRFDYDVHRVPCCLQVNKGLTKEKCQAQFPNGSRNSLGDSMGWRPGTVWILKL
eukprot:Skav216342  [mRNA]  locus=scaffold3350:444098:444651:- [translate_table: standard]